MKITVRQIVALCIASFFFNELNAQRIITGRVIDFTSKKPVENAAVTIFKSTITTETNDRGYFQLEIQDGDSILITHQYYKSGFLNIPGEDVFIVYLEPNENFPHYLDGVANLYQYLQQSLVYPSSARMKRIEGVLLIKLIIGEDGKLIGCQFLNELGGNCEKTALKVFNNIPGNWSQSSEQKSIIFPLVYILNRRTEIMELPDVELPYGKMMEKIIISAINDYQSN